MTTSLLLQLRSKRGYPFRKDCPLSRVESSRWGALLARICRGPAAGNRGRWTAAGRSYSDRTEMTLTIRQRIRQLLMDGEYTAKDISRILGIKEKEVYEHLPHVEKSLGNRLSLICAPARCLTCDFVFAKRKRLTTPGRCPVCRSEHVSAPVYGIRSLT